MPTNCKTVDSQGQCTSCTRQDHVVVQGRCVFTIQCAAGQYFYQNRVCVDKMPNCDQHHPNRYICITCSAGYVTSAGKCCIAGTTYTNGACRGPTSFLTNFNSPNCRLVHPSTGYCMECNAGYRVHPAILTTCIPI